LHITTWTLETYAISKPQRERERETHTHTHTPTITVDAVMDFLAAYIKAKRTLIIT
jgi:hypothetical protein